MTNRTSYFALPLAGLFVLAGCGAPDAGHDAMAKEHTDRMAADSAAAAQVAAQEANARAVFEMFNSGDLTELENLASADFVDHQMPPEITSTGLQAVRDMVAMYRTSMPDVRQEWLSSSTSGDLTFIHFRLTGTNTGPWGPMPATGKAVDVNGVDVIRFQDGKAVEHWGYMEEMKMMEQLGLMPGPDEAKQ